MRGSYFRIFSLLFTVAFLCSCSGGEVKKTLGLSRGGPDEFMVISRPPLSVPPDFSLEPPSEKELLSNNQTSLEAEAVLFSQNNNKSSGKASKGELALLREANTNEANPKIREVLIQEQKEQEQVIEEKGPLDSITDYLTFGKDEPTVDVDKEEERLATNAKEGKPVNEGEVPVNQPSQSGVLNKIIGD